MPVEPASTASSRTGSVRLALAWAAQIVPPLALLVLFVTPWESFAQVLWLVAGIAALGSTGRLVRLALARSRAGGSAGPGPSRAIRPALTVLLFVAAALYMADRSAGIAASADALGREIAAAAAAACTAKGHCPEAPPGWELHAGRSCRAVEFMRVCYRASDDRSTFHVQVRHRTDDTLDITGGVDRPLVEQATCC